MQQLPLHQPDVGDRLDRVLARRLGLSRKAAWQLLEEGRVRRNGRAVSQREKGVSLASDDVVEVAVHVRPDERRAIANPQLPLTLPARGPDWLIAEKPAGMPVHPLRPGETATLLNAVIARYPHIHGVGEGALRSGVVHRLDVETSGLVAFAISDERWEALRAAFREHRVSKQYLALVHGRLTEAGREAMHLAVAQHRPARVRVVHADDTRQSRLCSLAWQVRDTFKNATLVEVDLHTGFLHQIRVMFAHLGHPVVGDTVYGPTPPAATRLMLHAHRLAADEHLRAQSPMPPAFQAIVQQFRTSP